MQPDLKSWLSRKPKGKAPKKPLPKVSAKRAVKLREYSKVRKVYLKFHPQCEYPGCIARSAEIHHKKRRLGELLNESAHFMAICSHHHRIIHHDPKTAQQMGLLT